MMQTTTGISISYCSMARITSEVVLMCINGTVRWPRVVSLH